MTTPGRADAARPGPEPGGAGPGNAGPDGAGPGGAGPGDAGPHGAGPGNAGPGGAGPGSAGRGRAGPGGAGQGGAQLTVSGVDRAFGGVYAVRDVSLTVAPGELRAVIGPNGAGKSTLFALIGGQLAPQAGEVLLDGVRIDRLAAHRRSRLGISVVFQGARIFHGMTALENVMVGAHATTRAGFLAGALRLPVHHREERLIREHARECLARAGIADWADRPAEELPLGQQRALQLARALCARPRLLLLDEPASGLRAGERERLAALISELRAEGLTMLLVEHDVAFVMRLADRVTVLDLGRVIAEGTAAEIRADPRVIAAYLGPATEGSGSTPHPAAGSAMSDKSDPTSGQAAHGGPEAAKSSDMPDKSGMFGGGKAEGAADQDRGVHAAAAGDAGEPERSTPQEDSPAGGNGAVR